MTGNRESFARARRRDDVIAISRSRVVGVRRPANRKLFVLSLRAELDYADRRSVLWAGRDRQDVLAREQRPKLLKCSECGSRAVWPGMRIDLEVRASRHRPAAEQAVARTSCRGKRPKQARDDDHRRKPCHSQKIADSWHHFTRPKLPLTARGLALDSPVCYS